MFRSFTPPVFEDFDLLRYPHLISRFEKGKDGQLLRVTCLEDDKPIIDPLLEADWTDVQNMISNGISISPIGSYIQSSIEDRAVLLQSGIDVLHNLSEPITEPTPVPTTEPTPVPTTEPTTEPNV